MAVICGGNSAGQAAIFLARKGLQVHLMIRDSMLESSMSRYLIDEVEKEPTITLRRSTQVRDLLGSRRLERIAIDTETDGRSELEVSGLFAFIGADPNSEWLDASIERDEYGFVLSGLDLRSTGRLPLETSRPAVFAVGDVRQGSIKRVGTAVGEGSMVVRLVHERLASNAYVAP